MAYNACVLYAAGDVQRLRLSDHSNEDFEIILSALEEAGYITVEQFAPDRRRWRAAGR